KTVWVSGSNGTVARSLDSGKTWKWLQVKGFEKTDFRDIEAFSETSAVIMGIESPGYILRTFDGGDSWNVIFKDTTKGVFMDAMEFWNEQSGIVVGDPLDGKFYVRRTFDGGITWQSLPPSFYPVAAEGEACFASSGTNVRKRKNSEAIFVSGGKQSNLFIRDKKINIPIIQGGETTGANSVAVKNKNFFIVVGGDFNTKDSAGQNCAITKDAGKSWSTPETSPHGYRSCIEYLRKHNWITCGLNGVDYTTDDGKNFTLISTEGFHVVRKAKEGKAVFFAGSNGRIGKLVD
ncbi:MAG: oxidoreductase, partial [Ferruginibacter sp.]